MARDLQADLETLRTVLNLAQSRDIPRAAALAEKTLASGFEHPLLLNVLATQLELTGRLEPALKLLERAVAIAPDDVPARNALAACLLKLERPADALVHIDELLRRHPDLAFAHANRGNALIGMGALGQAREAHLRAIELEPANVAAAVALASIATQHGEHAEARRWAELALAKAPGFPDAIMSIAAADLAEGAVAAAELRLQQLIMDSRASQLDRARASGLLADVLDAAGRYRDAFSAYETCNQSLRKIYGRLSGNEALHYAHALTAAVLKTSAEHWRSTPPLLEAATAAESGTAGEAGHVFLIGFPRSGTTLLEVVLDGHPNIVSLEEHELLLDGVLRYMREPLDLAALAQAGETDLTALRAAYWNEVRRAGLNPAGKVFIDKHPLNTLKLPLIAKLFPRAKILFAVRDPRDVVLSCFRRRFKMNPAMYELLTLSGAAAFYDAVLDFAQTVRPILALDWRVVRYEDVVADFERAMSAVCNFLGIVWSPEMMHFADRVQQREHATPSTAQLSRGLTRDGLEQWRRYEPELQTVLPTLEPWVQLFGY
jgi:Flp pilus assembly protein TadD